MKIADTWAWSAVSDAEKCAIDGQLSLFDAPEPCVPAPAEQTAATEPVREPGRSAPPSPACRLNAEQQAAACTCARVIAVPAGAGTGKTWTLAARIAHMIGSLRVPASRIVAVTPTMQAADELRQRAAQMLGGAHSLRGMTAGTFYAVALARRRRRGLPGMLIAPDEGFALAAQAVRETGWDGTPEEFLRAVSALKNGADEAQAGLLHEQMAVYDWKLRVAGAVDRDDLLLDELEACCREKRTKKPLHVLIDEFQAVNDTQYQLARAWSAGGTLFVTGDPARASGGVRPAQDNSFARLAADEPELAVVHLTRNTRAAPEILACTKTVAVCGAAPSPTRPAGGVVRVVQADDAAEFVAHDIGKMAGMDASGALPCRSLGGIAVLCRTRRQLDRLEHALTHASIPCAVKGRGSYLYAPRVHGMLAFLRFLKDPADALSLRAALRALWECPPDKIDGFARRYEGASAGCGVEELCERGSPCAGDERLRRVLSAIEALYPVLGRLRPARLLTDWAARCGWENDPELGRLIQLAAGYKDVPSMLNALLLGAEGDLIRKNAGKDGADAVTLATLCGAVGTEFDAVYLCDAGQDAQCASDAQPVDIFVERRLLYEGMIRARDELVLVTQDVSAPLLRELSVDACTVERAFCSTESEGVQLSLFSHT